MCFEFLFSGMYRVVPTVIGQQARICFSLKALGDSPKQTPDSCKLTRCWRFMLYGLADSRHFFENTGPPKIMHLVRPARPNGQVTSNSGQKTSRVFGELEDSREMRTWLGHAELRSSEGYRV